MALIFDTHVLIWIAYDGSQIGPAVREAIQSTDAPLFVSAVTAWELTDLAGRGRINPAINFAAIRDMLSLVVIDLPAELWRLAADLPNIHGDPVDRMLIAHAIHADLTLVTADRAMRRYPVKTLW